MVTYTNYMELLGNILQEEDEVIFNLPDEQLVYEVRDCFLRENEYDDNDRIFTKLELPKNLFCEKHYGYYPRGGDWPSFEDEDFEAATRVVLALFKKIHGKSSLRAICEGK